MNEFAFALGSLLHREMRERMTEFMNGRKLIQYDYASTEKMLRGKLNLNQVSLEVDVIRREIWVICNSKSQRYSEAYGGNPYVWRR